MRCPFCHNPDSRVIETREAEEGATTRRRRSCPACGRRFTTVEEAVLAVVKRSGVSEPFNRAKVVAGVRRACQGRPVDEDRGTGDRGHGRGQHGLLSVDTAAGRAAVAGPARTWPATVAGQARTGAAAVAGQAG